MTIETRTTMELKDIKAIEFECATCHTKLTYNIDKFTIPLMFCTVCQKALIPERGKELEDIKQLIYLIERFSGEGGMYVMRFDVTSPKETKNINNATA